MCNVTLWLQGVDWKKVLAKHMPPPFKPYISSEMDTGNFSTQFTEQVPVDSPAQPPTRHQDLFRVGAPPQTRPCYSPSLSFSFLSCSRATLSSLPQFCSLTMCSLH